MKRVKIILTASFISGTLWAHCQVPCGIYDDANRIIQIREHIRTIEKAMSEIRSLSRNEDFQSKNQTIRWISTKEDHAQKIQTIVAEYFLTQRIKSKNESDNGYKNYVKHSILLHQILVSAMKCKQTVDSDHPIRILQLVNDFVDVYFDEKGRAHLNEHHEG